MREIQKSDIVGARIVDIHETYELAGGGLDCVQVYFTVDRGFTFTTPGAGLRWTSVELPKDAKRLPDEAERGWLARIGVIREPIIFEIVEQIKQQRISGVYCSPFDEKLGSHSPFSDGVIVFEDGSQLSNNVVAPRGTGGAGLHFYLADSGKCTSLQELVDYFSIPLRNSKA